MKIIGNAKWSAEVDCENCGVKLEVEENDVWANDCSKRGFVTCCKCRSTINLENVPKYVIDKAYEKDDGDCY